jgi:ketosteroid isomerase-like protein
VRDHPHAKLARAAWEAVSSSDVAALTRLTTDGITWHASGRGSRAGHYRGRAGILEYLAGIGDDVERFDAQLEDVLVGERHTAVLFRVSGRRGERQLDAGFVLILRIEGERIAEIWSVARDQFAVDEFWA